MGRTRSSMVVVLAVLAGCGQDEALEHGTVALMISPSESVDTGVFGPTTDVRITMRYGECLAGFYDAYPDHALGGPKGESIFGDAEAGGEGWKDRLCDLDDGRMIDCTVESFEQELGELDQLTVTLATDSPSELANRLVPVGPLPTTETAGCDACVTFVGLWLLDADGEIIQSAESSSPLEACTDQGGEMAVHLSGS